jgi:hypothetical protein
MTSTQTGRAAELTELLKDSLAFPQALVDSRELHDKSVERLHRSPMRRPLPHGLHHLALQLRSVRAPLDRVMASKHASHGGTSVSQRPQLDRQQTVAPEMNNGCQFVTHYPYLRQCNCFKSNSIIFCK